MQNNNELINIIGEKQYYDLEKLKYIIDNTGSIVDNKAYNDMLELIIKHSNDITNIYSYFIIKDLLNKYFNLCYRIILKMDNYNNIEIYKMLNYINEYTENNIDYKINIINEFKKIGIIEERNIQLQDIVSYNLYKKLMQVLSVTYKKDYKKDSKEVFEKSVTNELQNKAKTITKLVVDYNKKIYLKNQKYFVKPTNNIMEIICYLPDLIVDNEKDFEDLINYLYKLFYESKAIEYDENKKISFINNIRNYYFHDLEHGKEKDFNKKIIKVNEFFNKSIKKNFPENTRDWKKVQNYVYDSIIAFLKSIKL